MKIIQIGLNASPDSISGITDACPTAVTNYIQASGTNWDDGFTKAWAQNPDGLAIPWNETFRLDPANQSFNGLKFANGVRKFINAGKFIVKNFERQEICQLQ